MLVYRLAAKQYIRDTSGTGARLFGGRWNRKGTPLLYTSEHCSLALLEVIVHTPQKLIPDSMHLLKLFIPDDSPIGMIREDDLPGSWRQYPAPNILAEKGTHWALENETVALRVPSVLVPDEWNLLLNPNHSNFAGIRIESISPFQIDSRF